MNLLNMIKQFTNEENYLQRIEEENSNILANVS